MPFEAGLLHQRQSLCFFRRQGLMIHLRCLRLNHQSHLA